MRTVSVVVQRRPEPLHGVVQALIEVYKGVGGPELLLQFVPGDGLTRTLQQHGQDFDRLTLQPDLDSLFAQLPRPRVELEDPEAQSWRR